MSNDDDKPAGQAAEGSSPDKENRQDTPREKRDFDLEGFKPRADARPTYRGGQGQGGQGSRGGYRSERSDSPRGGSWGPRDRGDRGARGGDWGGRDRGAGGWGNREGGFRDRKEGAGRSEGFKPRFGRDESRPAYRSGPPARNRDEARGYGDSGGYRGGYRGGERSGEGTGDRGGFRKDRDDRGYGGGYRSPRGEAGGYRGDRGGFRRPEGGQGYEGGRAQRGEYKPAGVRRISDETVAGLGEAGLTPKASPEIRLWLQLKTDKGRYRHSRFLLEGQKAIQEILELDPGILVEVFTAPDFKDETLLGELKRNRIKVLPVEATDIGLLSDTETPQGIIAVANFAALKPNWTTAHAVTLLDGIQDPGNVGAIFRTSLALGMDAVLVGKGCCDPYNSKVVRSSVGAMMRMPFDTDVDLPAQLSFLRQKGFSIVATSSHAKITLDQATLKRKVALVVGNEGSGSGANLLDIADAVVKIPLKKSVESLNVSVAHGILSYELMRSRGAQLS